MLGSLTIKGVMTATPAKNKQPLNKKVTVFIFYEEDKAKDFIKIIYKDDDGKEVLIKVPGFKWQKTNGDFITICCSSGKYEISLMG